MLERPGVRLSRRELLKISSVGALVGSMGYVTKDGLAPSEVPRVETGDGIFHMLYERHDLGPSQKALQTLPTRVDLFWEEFTWLSKDGANNLIYIVNPEELGKIPKRELRDEILKRNADLVFGDVIIDQTQENLADILLFETGLGVGLFGTSHLTNRRDFLRLVGNLGLLYSLSLPTLLVSSRADGREMTRVVRRSLERFYSLQSHFHPEQALVFFRNVVWADKLLTLAEHKKKELGRKPQIAVEVGAAHAGVEDFLIVGRDLCRKIVTSYPKDFVRRSVALNGGIDNFCSNRIMRLYPLGLAEDKGMVADEVLKAQLTELLQ